APSLLIPSEARTGACGRLFNVCYRLA
ncbi:TPA: thymidine kinase, partial [Klebsiella pneumoniae]|nr:thymidine kinase [Klebsiella pneumoniae]